MAYFSKEKLKIFNDDLLKYMRSCWRIGFDKNLYTKNILLTSLAKFNVYKRFNKYDNKIKLNDNFKAIEYEKIKFVTPKQLRDFRMKECHGGPIYEYITIDIDTKVKKQQFIDSLDKDIKKLTEFKLYLESYFLKNDIPKTLFIKERKLC